jgi:tetratricopeptide (TPR) repeat protein
VKTATWAAVLIVVAVAAAHGGALRGTFHYDDLPAVTENLAIRTFQPLAYLTSPDAASAEPGSAGFRPVTVLTFAANYAAGRLDAAGYLAANLVLHALISWMVFVVGRLLLRDDAWALLAALVYAVHPLNAESVNYVVARSSLLAALGSVVTMWAFFRRRTGGGWWWTGLAVAAFAVALLSKEAGVAVLVPLVATVVMDPAAGAAHDRRKLSEIARDAWLALWPYGIAVSLYLVAWWLVAGAHAEQHGRTATYPLWTFVEIVGRSLLLWVWPWPLGLDHPVVFATRFSAWTAGWLAAWLTVLLGAVFVCRTRWPIVSWCLLWALAGLVPLAPLPWTTVKGLMQENRMAFSAIALAWLTAVAARAALSACRRAVRERLPVASARIVPITAGVVAVVILVAAVASDWSRSSVWADDVRLWQEVVARSPESRTGFTNLGAAYMARNEYDHAEDALRRAIEIAPNDAFPYYALGMLAYRREQYDFARVLFVKSASLAPDYAKTYRMLGIIALKQHRDEDGAQFLQRALTLDPRDATATANLGLAAQRAGDNAAAHGLYRDAIALDPAQPLARNNLGTLYLQRRQWGDALEQFSALVAAAPDDYDAALNRAVALHEMGRKDEARGAFEALLASLPPDPKFDMHRRAAELILHRTTP